MRTDSPRSVGILGYGRFGKAFAELSADAGVSVSAYDPHADVPASIAADCVGTLAKKSEAIVLAVPMHALKAALTELRPHLESHHLILDAASVKKDSVEAMRSILGSDIPWAATHPLFGPMSVARGEKPFRAVVCPTEEHPSAAVRARALYESVGCSVIEESADVHDQVMARTHALAFFVAKGMLDAGTDESVPFAPPSFQAIAQTIAAVRADAGHLFLPIARDNPHAAEARERLIGSLQKIHGSIADEPETPAQATEPALSIAPTETPPQLRETRDLIDEIDEDILALLTRRLTLSLRAARVKAESGRPVRDPDREKDLLDDRARRARERGLDEEGVRSLFEALLALSRSAQEQHLRSRTES